MARFSGQLSRTTSHRTPKHQLYQPGFNPANSCWLDGDWITLSAEEFRRRKAAHERLYKGLHKQMESQHHRDKATALKDMTPAQRQAWEFYSGDQMLDGFRDGVPSPCRVRMAGNAPMDKDAAWLTAKGYRFPRWVKHGPKAKPFDQLRGLRLPPGLVEENSKDKPFDSLSATVRTNKKRMDDMFDSTLEALDGKDAPGGELMGMNFQQFSAMMAFQSLIRLEEDIVREEWERSMGDDDGLTDLEEERKKYADMRSRLKSKVENFEEALAQARASHNECERANLDNSKGHLFCFVLPKFNDDGTHDPVGERDVPWAQKPRRAKAPQEARA